MLELKKMTIFPRPGAAVKMKERSSGTFWAKRGKTRPLALLFPSTRTRYAAHTGARRQKSLVMMIECRKKMFWG